MIVLDTDMVTHLSYGNQKVQERLAAVPDEETIAVVIVTRMEVLQGRHDSILKAANPAEMQTASLRFQPAEEMLSDFIVLYPDEASCRHFETLLKQKRRTRMRRADMVIASIALAHGALLVTRNTRDYEGVKDLRLENWAD